MNTHERVSVMKGAAGKSRGWPQYLVNDRMSQDTRQLATCRPVQLGKGKGKGKARQTDASTTFVRPSIIANL